MTSASPVASVERLLGLRPGEGRTVALTLGASCAAAGGLMIAQSSAEALFFARYGVDALPTMYLVLGATMFVATLAIGVVVGRLGRGRAAVLIPVGLAVAAVAGRIGLAAAVSWIYPALWLLQGVAQFVLGLSVWGLAGIVTDTRQAKRFFPLIGAGGVLGSVVGGLATRPLAAWLGAPNLLLVWVASLAIVVALGVRLLATNELAREDLRAPRDATASAIDELRKGLTYVRRSALTRWLSVAAVLFSLLFFSLYLPFSRAAAERYPSPDDLAGFFGPFFGVAMAVAFALSLLVTNRLLRRFGVPAVMLVLPAFYVAAFGVLTAVSTFSLLATFRFVQVAWLQGGASSAWEAVVNTVPADRRDQTRAFLYGGPTQVGTILAGLVALVGERAFSPTTLYAIGLAAGVLATVAVLRIRKAYPRELMAALREARPHVFDAPSTGAQPFGHARVDAAAVTVAVGASRDPDPRVRRVAAHVLGDLAAEEARTALLACLEDADDEVRANAVASLARSGAPDALVWITLRSSDPSALVRRAAVDALGEVAMPTEAAGHLVGPLLHDPDPLVSASAAGMFARAAGDPAAVSILARLAGHTDAGVRAAAFRSMRGVEAPRLPEAVRGGMRDPSPPVRAAAARAAPSVDPADALDALVEALADEHPAVRRAAADGLADLGAPALGAVLASLDVPARYAGAVLALERLPLDGHGDTIRRFVRAQVDAALERHRVAVAIGASDGSTRLLRDSLLHRAHEDALVALRASALVGRRASIDVALEHLTARDPAQRANALEVIESVSDRHLVRPLLELWEPSPARSAPVEDLLSRLADDPDGWIRACAALVSAQRATHAATDDRGGTMPTTLPTLSTMERVLFLRKVPLFAGLPPPDLQPIAAIAREEVFDDGDVLAEQGDVGRDMYVVVDGRVAVVARGADGDRTLAVRTSGDVVGEMAVLTFEPRMAALVAAGPVRALTLSRPQFEAILRERPETSLGVIRVLCQRLTAAGGDGDR